MRPDPHFTIRDIEVKRTIRRAFATAILIVGGLVAANGGSGLGVGSGDEAMKQNVTRNRQRRSHRHRAAGVSEYPHIRCWN
jgi:hypothetical protein